MRIAQKKQIEDFLKLLDQVHEEIRRKLEEKDLAGVMELLGQCQEGALGVGNLIERAEGEKAPAIPLLENYCELIYQLYETLARGAELNINQSCKRLRKAGIQIENSVRNEIRTRYEIVFLPYKASMWDSMESVWQAADADPDCDAYVVPIPYYDRQPDGSLGSCHYEWDQFPSYVPTIHYRAYPFEERKPDAIYIHNPYDYANFVTTIAPEFYSHELKKYTDCLVYIPYYSTAGGMSEGQASCPVYYEADYIIIQAEKYRKFYDPALPKEKLIPLGSPKFDKVLRLCQNPPEPPAEWKEKMAGKKVYFYNTSLNGMLSNTEHFLKKMEYVFRCFKGRKDACLLWRPHPLMESTFQSMRAAWKPEYDALREKFIREEIGIYDDTPDIANTIALCDAYIGDSGTSVTSLFGMAGKPLFILDNDIDREPEEEDWRGILGGFPIINGIRDGLFYMEKDSWMITRGNQLYRSFNRDGHFRYFCELSEYTGSGYYGGPLFVDRKMYVYPLNAQDILQIGEEGIAKRIPLKRLVERPGAFYSAVVVKQYLFLIPNLYPLLVRYDTEKEEVRYFDIDKSFFLAVSNGERLCGAAGVKDGKLYLASPLERRMFLIEAETGVCQMKELSGKVSGGYMMMASLPGDEDIWLLPYSGLVITRWNPDTGEVREYPVSVEGFRCRQFPYGYACEERPFSSVIFYKEEVYLSPYWGNKYIRLNKNTGEVREWIPPIGVPEEKENGYFLSWARGYLNALVDGKEVLTYRMFSLYDRKFYKIDFETNRCEEIPVIFDREELEAYEPGFKEESQGLQYACLESAFNSLSDFLDGNIKGRQFDRERGLLAYRQLSVNSDGSCGEKIHWFVKEKLKNGERKTW